MCDRLHMILPLAALCHAFYHKKCGIPAARRVIFCTSRKQRRWCTNPNLGLSVVDQVFRPPCLHPSTVHLPSFQEMLVQFCRDRCNGVELSQSLHQLFLDFTIQRLEQHINENEVCGGVPTCTRACPGMLVFYSHEISSRVWKYPSPKISSPFC